MSQRKQNLLAFGAWGMALLIIGGITFTFNKVNATAKDQTQHNIDSEAHPTIAGQLNMIEYKLDEILRTVNGG